MAKHQAAGFGVSTHSRLKAAGNIQVMAFAHLEVSTHSRLKAAGPSEFGGGDN